MKIKKNILISSVIASYCLAEYVKILLDTQMLGKFLLMLMKEVRKNIEEGKRF